MPPRDRRNPDRGRVFLTVRISFLFPSLSCGCDLGDPLISRSPLDAFVRGKRVVYSPNQSFQLELDLNTVAGYSWSFTLSETTVMHLDSTSCRPKNGNANQVGGLSVETLHFRAIRPGECSIALDERRGWLPNDPPIHSVQFGVAVRR